MKKFLLSLALSSAIFLSSCTASQPTASPTQSSAQSSQSSSASSTVASSTSSSRTDPSPSSSGASETSVPQQAPWSEDKTVQLKDYILTVWGPSMGQEYRAYTPATQGNWYGTAIPDQILEVPAGGLTVDLAGQTPDLVWSSDGQVAAGQLGLVAVFSDIEHVTQVLHMPAGAHLYLFTIDETGAGQVWISQQNQGNNERRFYFTETQNADLRNFFVQLVGQGRTPGTAAQTEAVTSSVDTKNLTIDQSARWAAAHAARRYGTPYTRSDFLTAVTGIDRSPDGLVYVEVRENHDSANMRAAGADPHTAPIAGFYRINAFGELEEQDVATNTYRVVETTYME